MKGRKTGTVKAVFPKPQFVHGDYGFIQTDDLSEDDYFFHRSACDTGELPRPGDGVEFTPMKTKDGRLRAVKVSVILEGDD